MGDTELIQIRYRTDTKERGTVSRGSVSEQIEPSEHSV